MEKFRSSKLKDESSNPSEIAQKMVHCGNGKPFRLSLGSYEFDSRMNRINT